MAHPLALDMLNTAFSTANSYLRIIRSSRNTGRLLIGTCRTNAAKPHRINEHQATELFEIAFFRNQTEIPYLASCMPWQLLIHGDNLETLIAFEDPETIIIETRGGDLLLIPCQSTGWNHLISPNEYSAFVYNSQLVSQGRCDATSTFTLSRDFPVRGLHSEETFHELAPLLLSGGEKKTAAFRFSQYERNWAVPLATAQATAARKQEEVLAWISKMPEVPERYFSVATKAWSNIWLARVAPTAIMTRPSILVSKFTKNRLWLWHSCFTALTIAKADPELAWAQIHIFLDHQTSTGLLPDAVDDSEITYGFTKPPLIGLTLRLLVEILGLEVSRPHIEACYRPLEKNTRWWLEYRKSMTCPLPQYMHSFDSGWDLATLFDEPGPISTPDLPTFLSIQMETLSFMAGCLGKPQEEKEWAAQAGALRTKLFQHSLHENTFVSLRNGQPVSPSLSLLNLMPILLNKHLPDSATVQLIRKLSTDGPYLTPFGLATESPSSPQFQSDLKYRGPIYGHINYLFVHALDQCGEKHLAGVIAEKFCEAVLREPSLHERLDAVSGKGVGCPGHLSTACSVILLASWLQKNVGQ